MSSMKSKILIAIVLVLVFGTSGLWAITLLSFDNFAVNTDHWIEGAASPNPPTWSSNPGQDGITPGHLISVSDGSGAGGRQLIWNDNAEWTGNYMLAGVDAIELWADNRSGTGSNLNLRIAFDGLGGWFVSNPQIVSDIIIGDEWTKYTFSLTPVNFTWIAASGGSGIFNDTLASVGRFEILVSSGLPSYGAAGDILQGDQTVSDLRFDDIAAVPEPNLVMFIGILGIVCFIFKNIGVSARFAVAARIIASLQDRYISARYPILFVCRGRWIRHSQASGTSV